MRILLDYRPALRERTGVGEYVHELARALARTATADEIAILSSSWKDRPAPELADQLGHVRIVDRRLPVRGLTWAWNRLEWPPVEWLAGDADVVHSQNPLRIPAARAAQVVTVHDLDFLHHPERTQAEMRRDFPRLARQHALAADHVIVSSHYAAREVVTHLELRPERVSVCSPGTPDWTEAIAAARSDGVAGTAILFIGTIEPRKNIDGLLEAYARLCVEHPDTPPLVLAGNVGDSVRDFLDKRLAEPVFERRVRRLGYVSDEQRRALYRDARMLVLPSHEEGFGLPVLEAMACGVPVVVSNRGSLPEVAGDAASPVDPNDGAALAAEMSRLLRPEFALAAIARGRAQAARYSWDAAAAAAREAYRAAVAQRETRRP